MKITVLTRGYPTTSPGGMPNVCGSLCEGLAKAGHEITVLTMSNPNKSIKEEVVNNVRIEYLPCPTLRYTPEWFKLATKRVGELKQDLIYSESGAGSYVVDSYPAIPSIQRLHGFSYEEIFTSLIPAITNPDDVRFDVNKFAIWVHGRIMQAREDRMNAQKYDCLIGLTEVNVRNIKYVLQSKRVEMIRNGIDIDRFDYMPEQEKIYDVLFTGNLTKLKGIGVLNHAMGMVKEWNRNIRCVAFGSNTEKHDFINIEYKGALPNDEMPGVYNQAKIFVNPTLYYTGMDTTIMEATCCGLPCIVSEGENMEEIINEAAIYGFPRGNAEVLAGTIIALLKEVNILDNRKIANSGKILFSQERMVKEHIRLFDSLINK
ncbi:MAG: glycosyltransferase family 4 protein [Planctomycetota bacterium]